MQRFCVLFLSNRAASEPEASEDNDAAKSHSFPINHEPLPQLNSVARYQFPSHMNGEVPSPEEVCPHPLVVEPRRDFVEVTPCAPEEDEDEEIPREWDNTRAHASWRDGTSVADVTSAKNVAPVATDLESGILALSRANRGFERVTALVLPSAQRNCACSSRTVGKSALACILPRPLASMALESRVPEKHRENHASKLRD